MEQLLMLVTPYIASKMIGFIKESSSIRYMAKTPRVWLLRTLLGVFSIGSIVLGYLLTGNLDAEGIEIAIQGILGAIVAGLVYKNGKDDSGKKQ